MIKEECAVLTISGLPGGECKVVAYDIDCLLCNKKVKVFLPNKNVVLANNCIHCSACFKCSDDGNIYYAELELADTIIQCDFEMKKIIFSNEKDGSFKVIPYKNHKQLQRIVNTYKIFM